MLFRSHRVNLHASYAIFEGESADRDELKTEHFAKWIEFAKKNNIGLDMLPTFFSHNMVKDGLTLSSPDEKTRKFWVRHGIACREVCRGIAKELNSPALYNLWIPDGYKDTPSDRIGPRLRLKESLDEIFAEDMPGVINSVESKLFGIGAESYTVGSLEFYLAYAAANPGVYLLLDNGHYHPTESVSDKIPSLLAFFDKLPLHVTRSVRWDSDHVTSFDDETREMAREIIRCGGLSKALIGLDFFDASINRVAAWINGMRNMQKALLTALLTPFEQLKQLQDESRFTELLVRTEEQKTLPFGAVWDEFCERNNAPKDGEWFEKIVKYEKDVLLKRV